MQNLSFVNMAMTPILELIKLVVGSHSYILYIKAALYVLAKYQTIWECNIVMYHFDVQAMSSTRFSKTNREKSFPAGDEQIVSEHHLRTEVDKKKIYFGTNFLNV